MEEGKALLQRPKGPHEDSFVGPCRGLRAASLSSPAISDTSVSAGSYGTCVGSLHRSLDLLGSLLLFWAPSKLAPLWVTR